MIFWGLMGDLRSIDLGRFYQVNFSEPDRVVHLYILFPPPSQLLIFYRGLVPPFVKYVSSGQGASHIQPY